MSRTLAAIACAAFLFLALAVPARADDVDEKMEALELRIEILVDEARYLFRRGHEDAAEVLEKRVHVLKRELAALREEEAREDDDDDEVEDVLAHVFETLNRLVEAEEDKEAVQVLMRALEELAEQAEEDHEAEADRMGHSERAAAKKQLVAMHVAFKAFREAEKKDAAHLMEHAIHALELRLAGRDDAEASRVYRTAPTRRKLVPLLRQAGELWEGWGHETKAAQVRNLARQWAGVEQRGQGERPGVRLGPDEAKFCLQAMKVAIDAFRGAKKPELAETMRHAASALAVQLEGRDDPEARAMVARRPKAETVIELLLYAGKLYGEWDKEGMAAVCTKAGKLLLARHREGGQQRAVQRAQPKVRAMPREHAEAIERFEKLQQQTRELLEMARRMQAELVRLQREMER